MSEKYVDIETCRMVVAIAFGLGFSLALIIATMIL